MNQIIYTMKTIIFIIAFSIINVSFAQYNFYKSFNIYGLTEVIETDDGGFACVNAYGNISKIDSTAQIIFHKEISSGFTYSFHNIIQTKDGGFIVQSPNNPINDYGIGTIIKFDYEGNHIWAKRYYFPSVSSNSIKDIISLEDNGFCIVVSGCAGGSTLIKCNEFGEIMWQKTADDNNSAMKIYKYSDDKFLIFGMKILTDSIVKIHMYMVDTSGNYLWLKELDNGRYNLFTDFIKTDTSEFSILIRSQDSETVNSNVSNITIHLDSSGNILWSKYIYTNEPIHYLSLNDIELTSDKGYLYTGQFSFLPSGSRIICMKTDSLNNIEWMKHFGNISYDNWGANTGRRIFNKDSCYFSISSNGDGLSIAKLDLNGFGFCNYDTLHLITENNTFNIVDIPVETFNTNYSFEIDSLIFNEVAVSSVVYCTDYNVYSEIIAPNSINYYPNPTNGILTIEAEKIQRVIIFDLQGRIRQDTKINDEDSTIINLSEMPMGTYLFKIITRNGVIVKKVVYE